MQSLPREKRTADQGPKAEALIVSLSTSNHWTDMTSESHDNQVHEAAVNS